MARIQTVSIFLFVIGLFPLLAQHQNIENYNTSNGLPSNYIYQLDQDSLGYIWLATGNGLVRMDEQNFVNDSKTKFKTTESHVIHTLAIYNNYVWYTDKSGNIYKYSGTKTENIPSPFAQKIVSIHTLKNNSLLFVSATEGIAILNTKTAQFSDIVRTPNYTINSSYLAQNKLFLATNRGVLEFETTNETLTKKQSLIDSIDVSAVFELRTGELLVGTSNRGLFSYKASTNTLSPFLSQFYSITSVIKHIYKDSFDNLWISTFGEGIVTYTANSTGEYFSAKNIKHYKEKDYLYCNQVFEDYEGNIWIASYGDGINLLANNFMYDSNKNINDGNILALTKSKTKILFAVENHVVEMIKNNKDTLISLKKNILINCISIDYEEKGIYIGTEQNGVYYYNYKSKKTTHITLGTNNLSSKINTILLQGKNTWIATFNGLFLLNEQHKILKHYGTDNGLRHNLITALAQKTDGTLIIGTKSNRVFFLKNENLKEQKLPIANQIVTISTLYCSPNNDIFVGTIGNGLFKISGDKIYTYSSKNNSASDFIFGINPLDDTHILLFSETDMSVLHTSTNKINHISSKNSLPSGYNPNANITINETEILIGTKTGLFIFNTRKYLNNNFAPKIGFTKLTINDSIYNINSIDKKLKLPSGTYKIALDYKGVNFTHSDNLTYYYMLEGYEQTWHESHTPYAIYKQLTAGKYRFKVKVCNENNCTEKTSDFEIEIPKPFWQSLWFLIIIALLLIWIIIFLFVVQERNNKRNKKILEYSILLKNQELTQKETSLNHSLEFTKLIMKANQTRLSSVQNRLVEPFIVRKSNRSIPSDIYWTCKNEHKILFALIDSQEKEIPSGMLNVWLPNILNTGFIEHNTTNPQLLMGYLQDTIVNKLKHETIQLDLKITIGGIHLENQILEICSVNQEMMMLNQNNETQLISGLDTLIGHNYDQTPFKTHTFDLKMVNSFYFITDGYKHYNHLSLDMLSVLLKGINTDSGYEQKEKLETLLESSKQNTEYFADDLSILGFRVIR